MVLSKSTFHNSIYNITERGTAKMSGYSVKSLGLSNLLQA